MTFIPLVRQITDKERNRLHPVVMRVSPSKENGPRQFVTLTVRPHLMPEPALMSWWTRGANVSPLIGTEEDVGFLKVMPGGSYRLSAPSMRRLRNLGPDPAASPPRLIFTMPHMPPNGMDQTSVEFDYGEGWLIVTLPAWANPAPSKRPLITVPAVNPFKNVMAKKPVYPFKGVTASTGLGSNQGVKTVSAIKCNQGT